MKKKVLAAREALERGVPTVILADSRRPQPVAAALAGEGTVIGERIGLEQVDAGRPSGLEQPALLLTRFSAQREQAMEVEHDL